MSMYSKVYGKILEFLNRDFTGIKNSRYGGWSVISSNPGKYGSRQSLSQTSRIECVPPIDVDSIRLTYGNWFTGNVGETGNTNPIRVRASIQPQGATLLEVNSDPVYRVTFGGKDYVNIGRGAIAVSDPIPLAFLAGQRFFVKNHANCSMPSAPTAPTATPGGTGSSLSGVYGVCITIVYPDAVESAASTATSTTASSGQNITVTSPSAVVGAIGYRVWLTYSGGSQVGRHYDTGSGVVAFGTNYVITNGLVSANQESVEQVDPTGALYIPTGGGVLGGNGAGASNNGEAVISSVDRTGEGRTVAGNQAAGNVFSPVIIEGHNSLVLKKSCASIGDSISQATGDNGFGYQRGGFMVRAIMNQLFSNAYDQSVLPLMGHAWLGQGAETALQFASSFGWKRSLIAFRCTSVWSNYGTNDLALGPAPLANSLYVIGKRFCDQKMRFLQSDLISKSTSGDGWATIDNQLIGSSVAEATRRAINNWIASTTGPVAVTNEAPFRGYSGSKGPSWDFNGPGDGSITAFYTAHPFQQGTQSVTVSGVSKVITTDYTYLFTQAINGVAYASGINFNSAPANLADVRIGYTKMAGMRSMLGEFSRYMPVASSISVNSVGTADKNGGFTKISEAPVLGPKSLTGSASGTLTDSTQTWTQDQYRGWCVMIVTDTTTPSAVGQVRCIQYNTATVLTLGASWSVTPSVAATYKIFKCYQTDGTHPSTFGHIEMAKAADLSLIV